MFNQVSDVRILVIRVEWGKAESRWTSPGPGLVRRFKPSGERWEYASPVHQTRGRKEQVQTTSTTPTHASTDFITGNNFDQI